MELSVNLEEFMLKLFHRLK